MEAFQNCYWKRSQFLIPNPNKLWFRSISKPWSSLVADRINASLDVMKTHHTFLLLFNYFKSKLWLYFLFKCCIYQHHQPDCRQQSNTDRFHFSYISERTRSTEWRADTAEQTGAEASKVQLEPASRLQNAKPHIENTAWTLLHWSERYSLPKLSVWNTTSYIVLSRYWNF